MVELALGLQGCEIFPKQTQLAADEVGNWLNMPYFEMAHTNRYAIIDGQKLSLQEFLTHAEDQALSKAELLNWQPRMTEDPDGEFSEAPPCLKNLIQVGFPEGSRNNALFNMGVFARLKYPDNWRAKVEEYNLRFMTPGSRAEVKGIIKSLEKKDYRYKCSDVPLAPVCNKETCRFREFGIGQLEENPFPKPVLSAEALTGLVGKFVRAATAESEADPAAVVATFMVCFGIEAGPSAYYEAGETKHPARLNVVIVGESSKARKGVSASLVKAIFTEGFQGGAQTAPGPLSSGEGLINAVRDPQKTWVPTKKNVEGYWQVTDPGVEDKRLFVLDEEFASGLNCTKREGNTLSPTIRGLYDDGNASPLTKSNKISTTGAHVGIVTHITKAELRKKMNETEALNGFGNRFLWIHSSRSKLVPLPKKIPQAIKNEFRREIMQSLQHAKQGGLFEFSPAAERLWKKEYPRLSMAHEGLSGCLINRGEAMVCRLALIYALIAKHHQIEEVDLRAALALWQYSVDSTYHIFGAAPEDNRKVRILAALKTHPANTMSKTEIAIEVFHKHITSRQLTLLLDEMVQEGLVTLVEEATSGRTKINVTLKT